MKKIYFIAMFTLLLVACNRKETLSDKSVLKTKVTAQTELDTYIYNNFQKPYNIIVTYNWKDSDFEFNKFLYPPTESKIKPMLEVVKKVWIDSYSEIAGANFIKEVAPRQISLVGGYNVNENGTITLGFADSGMKITLFNVDQLDLTNHVGTRQYFHTIQHEYCHIINQKKPYSTEFGKITPNYTSVWANYSNDEANELGFITNYARANDVEDFAEMTSTMLGMSKTAWDAKVEAITDTKAKEAIRKKEEFVVAYFKSEWNIDFYALQAKVEEQMLSVLQ
ncbi:MAG: putative zinc-binding metallopeptidase [Capnocytophaga ochracea]|jgi:hypothetical protein